MPKNKENHAYEDVLALNLPITQLHSQVSQLVSLGSVVAEDPSFKIPLNPDGIRTGIRNHIAEGQAKLNKSVQIIQNELDKLGGIGLDLAHYNWRLQQVTRVYEENKNKKKKRTREKNVKEKIYVKKENPRKTRIPKKEKRTEEDELNSLFNALQPPSLEPIQPPFQPIQPFGNFCVGRAQIPYRSVRAHRPHTTHLINYVRSLDLGR